MLHRLAQLSRPVLLLRKQPAWPEAVPLLKLRPPKLARLVELQPLLQQALQVQLQCRPLPGQLVQLEPQLQEAAVLLPVQGQQCLPPLALVLAQAQQSPLQLVRRAWHVSCLASCSRCLLQNQRRWWRVVRSDWPEAIVKGKVPPWAGHAGNTGW